METLDLKTRLALLRRTTQQEASGIAINDENVFIEHANIIQDIGNIVMARENKSFEIDADNGTILRFLLYYFNGSKKCEELGICENPSVAKNLMLIGEAGTGKSLIMKVFSHYCWVIESSLAFKNIGVTELMNHYKLHGNINPYTYANLGADTIDGKPELFCLNDIGLSVLNQKNYGTEITQIIDEWLFSRYEIWLNRGYRYFITTNENIQDLKNNYDYRLTDRFKAFNILTLTGKSRR